MIDELARHIILCGAIKRPHCRYNFTDMNVSIKSSGSLTVINVLPDGLRASTNCELYHPITIPYTDPQCLEKLDAWIDRWHQRRSNNAAS